MSDKSLMSLVPTSLDEIIRKDREVVKLRIATPDELKSLQIPQKDFDFAIGSGPPKLKLYDWYPITFEVNKIPLIFIFSKIKGGNGIWNTSKIVYANEDWSGVYTQSGSYYALSNKKDGEPPNDMLLVLCSVLWQWGLGKHLGVPFVICD